MIIRIKGSLVINYLWLLLFYVIILPIWVLPQSSYANPEGGLVAAGEAIIKYNQQPNYTEIVQHTEKAVIDWRKFDIAPQEHTNFKQPSSESITLNRIHSDESSNINGQLTANGKLILINQNGIMFDQNSKVDVNGILATTANISNDQFMRSEKLKEQQLLFESQGSAEASIVNKGAITAAKGLVGLVAPNVVSSGLIVAKAGKVTLASGDHFTLDLQGDCLLDVGISEEVKSQILANTGQVIADGGEILLTAAAGKEIVNSLVVNKGLLAARSVSRQNGEIIISAEGSNAVKNNVASDKSKKQGNSRVLISGIIDVSGVQEGESGGKLQITGDCIWLMSGTLINASGHGGEAGIISRNNLEKSAKRLGSAGGEILIGGDYLGQGDVPAAMNLYVDPDVIILNDAIDNGDAGRNIFWSDGITQFHGSVYARALGGKDADLETGNAVLGGNLGDGGFIETSGKGRLDAQGNVDLTASNGEVGTYLLDPSSINIYGNFDPAFTSTDGSINLLNNLRMWIDFSDLDTISLNYQPILDGVNSLNITAHGLAQNDYLTLNVPTTCLFVGARIMLGNTGIRSASVTETPNNITAAGNDIYTITSINSNIITIMPNLKKDYLGVSLNQGYIATVIGKASYVGNTVNAVATFNYYMPVWLSSCQNHLGAVSFQRNVEFLSVKATSVSQSSSMDYIKNQENFTYFVSYKMDYEKNGSSNNNERLYINVFSVGSNMLASPPWQQFVFRPCLQKPVEYYYDVSGTQLGWNGFGNGLNLSNSMQHIIAIYNDFTGNSKTGLYVDGILSTNALEVCSKTTIKSLNSNFHFLGSQAIDSPLGDTDNAKPLCSFMGDIYEAIEYNSPLDGKTRNLIEQYQSAKWGIDISQNFQAITSYQAGVSGSSCFTTGYISRLSKTSNIQILADQVSLDLKNDNANFNLNSGKNLTITARSLLEIVSSGTVSTTAGNIVITLENGNIDLTKIDLKANNNGNININANAGSVTVGNMSASSIFIRANGISNDIIIPAGKSLNSTGQSNPLILVAGRNFINNNLSGFKVLNTSNDSYWRIYMNQFYGNNGTKTSYLGSRLAKYSMTYDTASVPTDRNNLLIYATATRGYLTINAALGDKLILSYGDQFPMASDILSKLSLTYIDYIPPDVDNNDEITGQPLFSTNYTQGDNKGNYNLIINQGTLSSDLGYVFNTTAITNFVQVDPKILTINLISNVSKEYDGKTDAILSAANYHLSGIYGVDSISLNNPSSGNYDNKTAGTTKNVTVTGLAISGAKKDNYTLLSTTVNANIGEIRRKVLNVSLTGAIVPVTKVYDGNRIATLTADHYQLTGKIGNESVSLNNPSLGSYDNANTGSGKNITVENLTIVGDDVSNYTLQENTIYANIGIIAPATVKIIADPKTKEYGSYDPTLTYNVTGLIGDDKQLDIIKIGTLTREPGNQVGTYNIVGSNFDTLNSNYNVIYDNNNSGKFTITAKTLNINNLRITKEYDSTDIITTEHVSTDLAKQSLGILPSDYLNITIGLDLGSVFSTKNAQSGNVRQQITIIGLTLGGGNVTNNYILNTQNEPYHIVDGGKITPKVLNISNLKITKEYDGTDAIISPLNLTPVIQRELGVIAGDTIVLHADSGSKYIDKSANENKKINIIGLSLASDPNISNRSNYILTASNIEILTGGTIIKKPLNVTLTGTTTKIYDQTSNIALGLNNFSLGQLVGTGDQVLLDIGKITSSIIDSVIVPSIGERNITVSGLSLIGNDANNYDLILNENLQLTGRINVTIDKIPLTVSLTGTITKVYDGSTNVILQREKFSASPLDGVLSGEIVDLNLDQAVGNYDTPSASIGSNKKAITVNNLRLSGDDSNNYILNNVDANGNLVFPQIGSITQKPLRLIGQITKEYDGQSTISLNVANLSLDSKDIIVSDDVRLSATGAVTGTYDNANFGVNNKTVDIIGLTLNGNAAGNYSLINKINNASINQKTVTIEPTETITKVYDSTTTAILTRISFGFAPNTIINQDLNKVALSYSSVSGTYDSPDYGEGKTITLQGVTLIKSSDVDAANDVSGNYQLLLPLTVNGNITRLPLKVAVNPPNQTTFNKVYDGTITFTIPTGTTYSLSNANSEAALPPNANNIEVNTTSITASYDSADVGARKTITFTGLSLKKKDSFSNDVSGNYSISGSITARGSINLANENQLNVTVTLGGATSIPTKIYDGDTNFIIPDNTTYELSGMLSPSDNITDLAVDDQNVVAKYDDIHVRSGKTITFQNLKLKQSRNATKDISNNYSIRIPVKISNAIITPQRLDVTVNLPAGNSLTKIYDASNVFTIPQNTTYSLNVNQIPSVDRGDIQVDTGLVYAEYNNSDVGNGKTISFKNLSLKQTPESTKDIVGNYIIAATPIMSGGSVTPKPVNITTSGIFTKEYDGRKNFNVSKVSLNFASGAIQSVDQGKVNLFSIVATASYNDANAGNSKIVTISGLAIEGAKKDNYVLNAIPLYTGTITRRDLIVSANPQSKKYGENDPRLNYNTDRLVVGEILKGELYRVVGESVANSPYAINQGTLNNDNNSNYNISYIGNNLTINKALLNVIANSYQKIEGQENPNFEASYSGFKFNDQPTLINSQLNISTTAQANSPAGNYTINVNGPGEIQNYTINYLNGKLTIRSLLPEILTLRESLMATLNESEITINDLNNLLNGNKINTMDGNYVLSNKINYVVNNLNFLTNKRVIINNIKLLMLTKNIRSLTDFFGIGNFNIYVDENYINIVRAVDF